MKEFRAPAVLMDCKGTELFLYLHLTIRINILPKSRQSQCQETPHRAIYDSTLHQAFAVDVEKLRGEGKLRPDIDVFSRLVEIT